MYDIFKGDVVQIKSGGPLMTVEMVGDFSSLGIADGAKCVWFDEEKKEEGVFDRAVLEKVTLEDYYEGFGVGVWLPPERKVVLRSKA